MSENRPSKNDRKKKRDKYRKSSINPQRQWLKERI